MALIRAFRDATPKLGPDVFVADSASVIGAVELEAGVSVWYGAVLRGDVGRIRIGARSNVQDNATIHMTFQHSDALIGSEVTVGHNAVSVVPPAMVVPPGVLVRGSPARVVRPLRAEETAQAKAAVQRYLELAREHTRVAAGPR
jgi:carbonic anhydrase/acetyltransferase-like protein (isoleucine patch superfamily)